MMPTPMPSVPLDFDPQKPRGRHHPAFGYTLVTILLLAGAIIFGFVTVFIPWAMVDLAPGQRAWAYPFKTCIERTFSPVNEETCIDNDFIEPNSIAAPLTQGDDQCLGFIFATIAFVFIYVIFGIATLGLLIAILLLLWSRPVKLFLPALILLAIVFVAAMLAFVMFICYAERECVPNSIFPVKGYSYGFVMTVFASAQALAAVITGCLAYLTLKSFIKQEDNEGFFPAPVQGFPTASGSPYAPYNNLALNTTPAFQGFM